MTTPSSDRVFWGSLGSRFDFTLKFEEVVFDISLSSAVIAILPFFFFYYYFEPVYIRRGALLWAKLVSIFHP